MIITQARHQSKQKACIIVTDKEKVLKNVAEDSLRSIAKPPKMDQQKADSTLVTTPR